VSFRKLWVLFLNAFVDMLGYAMVFPLLPLYALRLEASPTVIGLMVASFSVAQVAASPLWGRFSDRFGRRPALLVGLSGSCLAFLVFAFADSIGMLFLCRIVQGASGGTTSVMQAYIGDSVEPKDRAKALGWLSAATNAGVMIGPVVGSAAWLLGPHTPGLLAAGLCFVNLVSAFKLLPESKTPAVKSEAASERRSIFEMVWETLRHPGREASELIWIYAVAMTAFSSMTSILAIFLRARFGLDEAHIGYIFPILGAVSVFMRAGILGTLVSRFGEVRLMRAGALFLAVGLAAFPLPKHLSAFIPVMLLPIGTALLFPATSALLTQRCDPKELGQVLGVQQAFGGIARIFGPIWAGAAFERLGPGVPFEVAGVVVFGVALLAARVRPAPPEPRPQLTPEATR